MTLLINCQNISKSYGSRRIFKDLSLSVFSGDRLGLIGPNGAGKSTLIKIMAGLEDADSGIISPKRGLLVGYVPQSHEFPDKSPLQILIDSAPVNLEPYEKESLALTWLKKLGFYGDEPSATLLSGGWKKRLALAEALLGQPDLLLLDEPTNHLDLEGVLWLEKFLEREASTFICVSHDRTFLKNLTNRIIEIDPVYPEGLFAIESSFEDFLLQKQLFIDGQIQKERSVATKMRRETEWLRASPKARTTKSRSRIERAEEIIEEHSSLQQRNTAKKADISFEASERETRKLVMAKNVGVTIGERILFEHLEFNLMRGTRLGLIGSNGSGKTTLLKILAGEMEPSFGTVKRAEDLKIVTLDQHRVQLPLNLTLKEALSPEGDYVTYQGRPIHVNGWCKRFLFSPDSLSMPIGKLSGGERARIAIAHLMLKPADLLLLDEPANDLDIATLQTLEENLLEFPGAIVLITHDRTLLSTLCNLFVALGSQESPELYASFAQWEAAVNSKKAPPKPKEIKKESAPPPKKKLSYNEQRELGAIELKISEAEKALQALQKELELATPDKLQELCQKISEAEKTIDTLYYRFAELDNKIS